MSGINPAANLGAGNTNTQAYSSFSGIDLLAVVGDQVIATLQGISYSITREKAPCNRVSDSLV